MKDSSILVTGGTGSFGKAFIRKLTANKERPNKIVIYSRDELKQWNMRQEYPEKDFPELRFFIGDIRDKERLSRAFEKIDYVIHSAAMKQVPASEYNPMECIKTNVLGAQNIIDAALNNKVKRVIALSTDKAAAPINIYGASKLCADKLFTAANNMVGDRELTFSIVRYGNVMGSRGSVIPLFLKLSKTGTLPITSEKMTRFNITLDEGVDLVLWAIENTLGGEILVPKIPSYRILDVANAISKECKKDFIGLRPGEKLHEQLITSSDSPTTYDIGKYYIITPNYYENNQIPYELHYKKKNFSFDPLGQDFTYDSGSNSDFLDVEQIRKLIQDNLDSNYESI